MKRIIILLLLFTPFSALADPFIPITADLADVQALEANMANAPPIHWHDVVSTWLNQLEQRAQAQAKEAQKPVPTPSPVAPPSDSAPQ
jgi:hypothetical protein